MASTTNSIARVAATVSDRARRTGTAVAHLARRQGVAILTDGALAIGVAAATILSISVASEPDSRAPDAVAYMLGAVIGIVLLARRRWPLAVLLASAATLFVYYSLNYPGIAPAVPLAIALYTAVAAGYLRWGLPISAFFVIAGLVVNVINKHEPLFLTLTQMTDQAALLAVALMLGEVVRNRRQYMAEVRERLQRAERDRQREAARLVVEERLRIARELHDVMAHTITAITVQAGLAIDTLDDSPVEARTALAAIRVASREAMTEIKATIGVLRADEEGVAPRSPTPRLDQLAELIAGAQSAGVCIEEAVIGMPRPLSAAAGATAYRIVQESLTNIVRHSGASRATIAISYEPAAIRIEIADNGVMGADVGAREQEQQDPREQSGHGLIGMMERATALGGWLKAAPQSDGGFVVQAWLPTGEEE